MVEGQGHTVLFTVGVFFANLILVMKKLPRLAIIIPAYNEARVISKVLAAIPQRLAHVGTIKVVVVNDGSHDYTALVARKHGCTVLNHYINQGLGAALGTGLAYAREKNFDLAVTMDADGQHDPRDIAKLIQPLVMDEADIAVGTRLVIPAGMPWHRILGNWGLNVITFILYGIWTTDSQSGMRAFNHTALQCIQPEFKGMEISSGFFSEITRHRLRFREVPIRPIYTQYSLVKGQKNSNGFSILYRLFWRKLAKLS